MKKFCKLRETHSSCCGLGCGEVKCPLCIDRCDFDSYVLKKNSCLEKVAGKFQLKRSHNYFLSSPTTAFYITRKKVQWLCCLRLWQFPSCYNCVRKSLPWPWSHECCFAKTYHFLENMYFAWNFRQMVLKKVRYVWWDATSRCWNMLLQNAIRWKHCEMWKPSMPTCWISSILFGNFNPTSQGVVLPTLL